MSDVFETRMTTQPNLNNRFANHYRPNRRN
jgi:hypothetical protein